MTTFTHFFGCGTDRLTQAEIARRHRIAERHGVEFRCVAGEQGTCTCGRGCKLGTCREKRYWFAAAHRNLAVESRVMAEVRGQEETRGTN